MFTVLIAEKHYIDAIRLENKLFFEPFLENKELAFCYWDPKGQNLSDSVPDLVDTVGRRKEWKAVIINNTTPGDYGKRNPFDVVDYSKLADLTAPPTNPDSNEDWDNWEKSWCDYYETLFAAKEEIYRDSMNYPLQRLATTLSFRPEDYILNDVNEKNDIHDWALNELGDNHINPSVRLENLEREQYKKEIKLKEIIRREFVAGSTIGIAYPKEIYCISARTSENGFFNPEAYWHIRSKNEYSEFCDRNMYFDKMRFLVYDLLPENHRDFRCDRIKFLSTLLVFASNDVPSSTMEARRLYVLECENDDTPLFTLATSYDKKLAATYEVIDGEIERIYSEIPEVLTDKAAEALFCSPVNVEMSLTESCDFDSLYSDCDFDLLPASPESEIDSWNRSVKRSKKSYENIIRQQKRCVKKGVDRLVVGSELSEANVSRLTPFQLDDIRDNVENAENDMVSTLPPDLADISKYENIIEKKSNAVKNQLKRRMSRVKAISVTAIILFLMIVLYAPFLITNMDSVWASSASLTLMGVMLGVVGVSLIVALILLKMPLKSAVREYDDTMRGVAYEINGDMKKFSKYFSLSCNVRRGYKVLGYAGKNLDEYSKSIHIRKRHQEDIRRLRAELNEKYRDFIVNSSYCDKSMIQPYDYDFDKTVEYSYPAPFLAGFGRTIDFLEAGNKIEVPSGYIVTVNVRMEGIYDK